MKKISLILILFLIGFSASCQINQLIDNHWQLLYIYFEGDTYTPPANTFPDIDFTEHNGQYYASGVGVVNNFEGRVEIDEANSTISFMYFTITLADCLQPECWFESLYFFDMMSNQGVEKTFNYDIVYLGNSGSLELTDSDGNVAFYWDGNMSTQNFSTSTFIIYPNPVSNNLHIDYFGEKPEMITVYSISGKMLLEQSYLSSLDVSGLVSGIYFVEISSSEGKSVQKFVKK